MRLFLEPVLLLAATLSMAFSDDGFFFFALTIRSSKPCTGYDHEILGRNSSFRAIRARGRVECTSTGVRIMGLH